MNYPLDPHCQEIIRQYQERRHIFERMETLAYDKLRWTLRKQGIYVTSIEHRIKEEKSLAGRYPRSEGNHLLYR